MSEKSSASPYQIICCVQKTDERNGLRVGCDGENIDLTLMLIRLLLIVCLVLRYYLLFEILSIYGKCLSLYLKAITIGHASVLYCNRSDNCVSCDIIIWYKVYVKIDTGSVVIQRSMTEYDDIIYLSDAVDFGPCW